MSEHGPEAARRVSIVALFGDAAPARACLHNLQARGVEAALEGVAGAEESDSAMGRGVVLGATVGATAGFLAGTYLLPPGAVTATGSMLATLAGAGLGSFFGNLADLGTAAHDEGQEPSDHAHEAMAEEGWRLTVQVRPEEAEDVLALIAAWGPRTVRVSD